MLILTEEQATHCQNQRNTRDEVKMAAAHLLKIFTRKHYSGSAEILGGTYYKRVPLPCIPENCDLSQDSQMMK